MARRSYYIEKEHGGFCIYPRDIDEIAIHCGGPVDFAETRSEAEQIIERLEAEKRVAPTPRAADE